MGERCWRGEAYKTKKSWHKRRIGKILPCMICLNLLSTLSWVISSVSLHGLFVSWQPIWNFWKLKFQTVPGKQFKIIEGIANLFPASGSGVLYQLIYFLKCQFPLKYSCPLLLLLLLKSLQSGPTLCNPIDGSPPGSPVPGILQARTLEWVAISFSNAWKWKVKAKSLSRVWHLATPWSATYQAPPSMGFSRQEYWSGLPLSSLICCLYCSWNINTIFHLYICIFFSSSLYAGSSKDRILHHFYLVHSFSPTPTMWSIL